MPIGCPKAGSRVNSCKWTLDGWIYFKLTNGVDNRFTLFNFKLNLSLTFLWFLPCISVMFHHLNRLSIKSTPSLINTGLCSNMDYEGFLSKPISISLLISYDSQRVNQILRKPGAQLKTNMRLWTVRKKRLVNFESFTVQAQKWRKETVRDCLVFAPRASVHEWNPLIHKFVRYKYKSKIKKNSLLNALLGKFQ